MSSLFFTQKLTASFWKNKKVSKLFGENKKLALILLKRKFHWVDCVYFDRKVDSEGWSLPEQHTCYLEHLEKILRLSGEVIIKEFYSVSCFLWIIAYRKIDKALLFLFYFVITWITFIKKIERNMMISINAENYSDKNSILIY